MAHIFDPRLWDDQNFLSLDDGARTLYLYLMFGPERRLPGLCRETVVNLAERLSRPFSEAERTVKVLEAKEMVIVDRKAKVMCCPAAPDYAMPPNNNQIKGWFMLWRELPNCQEKIPHVARLRTCVKLDNERVAQTWRKTFGRVLAGEINSQSNSADLTLSDNVVQLFGSQADKENRSSSAETKRAPNRGHTSKRNPLTGQKRPVPNRDKIPD